MLSIKTITAIVTSVTSVTSQLSIKTITAIGANCRQLHSLLIEDCAQLPPESLKPLCSRRDELRVLSLSGLQLLCDEALIALLEACGEGLESLSLRGCSMLTSAAVSAVARCCPRLQVWRGEERVMW